MDYIANIQVTINFTARNEDQAEERSAQLDEWIKITVDAPKTAKWVGDVEIGSAEVEEV